MQIRIVENPTWEDGVPCLQVGRKLIPLGPFGVIFGLLTLVFCPLGFSGILPVAVGFVFLGLALIVPVLLGVGCLVEYIKEVNDDWEP